MTDSALSTSRRAMRRAIATTVASAIVATLLISVIGGMVGSLLAVREFGSDVLSSSATAASYLWLIVLPLAIGAGVAVGVGLPATAFVRVGARERAGFLVRCGVLGVVGTVVLWPFAALGGVVSTTWAVHWLNGAATERVSHFAWVLLQTWAGQWSYAHTLLTAVAGAVTPVLFQNSVGYGDRHRLRRALLAAASVLTLCAILCAAHALYLNRPVTMTTAAPGSAQSAAESR
ncbi:hypothetical protein ACFWUP_28310 [Nocardia sp. NPDC058658]|uniref:hypothetical protein n=1 Tax=Nocardia sp. NPDC058658 TaxID=3346580 RepID=UPI00364D7D0C